LSSFATIAVCIAIVTWLSLSKGNSDAQLPRTRAYDTTRRPTFRMDADHPTYPTIEDVSSAAETIITGIVVSHSTEPGESPGVDALGEPLPAIPHTNYIVDVTKVLKGSATAGSSLIVTLAGGSTPSGQFILDGAPEIRDSDTDLFFLQVGSSGKYYPLAGGAAVAVRNPEGAFSLPSDATGQEPLVFHEMALITSAGSEEVLSSQQPQAPSGSPQQTPTGHVLGATARHLVVSVRLRPHQHIANVLQGGLKLVITCTVPCSVDGKLLASTKLVKLLAVRPRGRPVLVASGKTSSAGLLYLHFAPSARKRLMGSSRVQLMLDVRAMDRQSRAITALSGTVTLTTSKVTLRR